MSNVKKLIYQHQQYDVAFVEDYNNYFYVFFVAKDEWFLLDKEKHVFVCMNHQAFNICAINKSPFIKEIYDSPNNLIAIGTAHNYSHEVLVTNNFPDMLKEVSKRIEEYKNE